MNVDLVQESEHRAALAALSAGNPGLWNLRRLNNVASPRYPDPYVFGPLYWPKAVVHPPMCEQRRCTCGVGWHDHEGERALCWHCDEPVDDEPEIAW